MIIKVPYYYLMARYRLWRRYPRGAVREYLKILEVFPGSIAWRYRLALAQQWDRQYDEVVKNVDYIVERSSGETTPYLMLKLRALMKLKRFGDVDILCSDLLSSSESYRVWSIRADASLQSGDVKKALQYYKSALDNSTSTNQRVMCLHTLGHIYEVQSQPNTAKKYYEEALSITTSNRVKSLGLGWLHQKRGWYEDAVDAYNQKLSIEVNSAEIYLQLGNVYGKLGNEIEAAKAYANFVKYDRVLLSENHKLNDKAIIFDAFMGRRYADSPKAIFEQLLKDRRYKDYHFVWVFRGKSWRSFWRLYINKRVKVVAYRSHEYYREYARCKFWITNSRLPFVIKTHPNQVYVQCWHGTPLKKLAHSIVGSSILNKSSIIEQYDNETRHLDFLLSPSKAATKYLSEAFDLKSFGKTGAIIEEGYPRNDFLAVFKPTDIIRIKRKLNVPRDKKVILYAPTWRDDSKDGLRYNYKLQINFDYMQKQLSKDWVVLFRPHYLIANGFNFRKYKGFVYDATNVEEVNDLYIISDVLMTDYSSVFFDYANLRRPIIFYMYDLDHYQNDLRGFYFDLKELPGDIVKSEDEIISILSDLSGYESRHATQYQLFYDKFNYLDDGKASKRVVERIFNQYQ